MGTMSAAEALSRILARSGLTYRFTGANSVTLEAAPEAADGAVQLGPVRVEGAGSIGAGLAASPASDMLATEGSRSYTTRGAVTSSKLPLTLRETPQSVTVITRQQIEDRNFITIDDAIEAATGMSATTANLGSNTFNARGFSVGNTQIDGIPGAGGTTGGYTPNTAMFDRIEIVRGAAGLVTGTGNPGGVVNLVRKRPLAEPRYGLVVQAGSWNQYRAEADISVPVTDWLRVRGVAAYEDRKYFYDLQHAKKPLFYGIAEIDVTPTTLFTVGGSYEDNRTDSFFNSGLPLYSDGTDPGLPRSSRGLAPGWNFFDVKATNIFASVEQQLGGSWKAKITVNRQHWDQTYVAPNINAAINPATGIGPRLTSSVTKFFNPRDRLGFDGQVSGEASLFGRVHELMFGASYASETVEDPKTAIATIVPVSQSIFDADPWATAAPVFGTASFTGRYSKTEETGLYGVARLNLADPLKVILGGRLSTYKTTSRASLTADYEYTKESNVFTPYGGIIYDFAKNWSLYASYADIFRVQNTLYTVAGDPLEPAIGANYEAGIKGEFYDGKLNTSFALFRIIESNRSQQDPDNPEPCAGSPTGGACYIADGKVRGQGFEAEMSGEVIPGLQIMAGYTYVNTKYLRDRTATGTPSTNEGLAFNTTTPKHLLRVWATYKLPGELDRLTIGGGINAQSRIYRLSGIYTIEQKAYALLSARIGFDLNDDIKLAVNANNLLDKTYYQRIGTLASDNRYGERRSVMFNARFTY
ncbi:MULTISPECIES: TonB-dependent siderophore receptor [Sphingobium]|uniref:TonB-dependent siderophore receptor n=1 Tax=Sphingobium TaxID=165695 RepID=UPI00242A9140|nr:TonB-dependent siderophore receptor [Sphingobium yanoikuyae]